MTGFSSEGDDAILASVLSQVQDLEPAPVEIEPKPEGTWRMPGFTGKSRVKTSIGELPIEALRRRDTLRTITGDYLAVEFVDKIRLDPEFLDEVPAARPVWVRTNFLGKGMPNKDLLISKHQRINLAHTPEEPKTIAQLLNRMALPASAQDAITLYVFHCGQPATILVDGLWCVTEPPWRD